MRRSGWVGGFGGSRFRSLVIAALFGLATGGCSEPDRPSTAAPRAPAFPGVKLTMGALGDATIVAGLTAQRGEWMASRGGVIAIKEEPIGDLGQVSGVDVLIFPGQELGDLVDAGLLEAIPNSLVLPPRRSDDDPAHPDRSDQTAESPEDLFQYTDIAPGFREQVIRYGSDRLALPLGTSALVLAYRREAFTRPANLEAARAAGLKLEPPSTWTQLDALARFFQGRDWNGDGTLDHGLAAVLGDDPESLGNSIFLARAASLGQHRDQYSFAFDADSLTPRIDSEPFAEALRSIVTWKNSGPPGCESWNAAAARESFRAGKTALLIDRAERAAAWSGGSPVGVAPLPGSERVFEPLRQQWETPSTPNAPSYLPMGGSWLVGVRKGLDGPQREAALDLARYLAAPENVNRLRSERTFPMLPVRASQMSLGLPDPTSAPDVDPRQWGDAVSRTLMAERVVPGLRIPEAGGYLHDLAKSRQAALDGGNPQVALRQAASLWSARTEARGRARQLWHYRRSLNSLATLPDPPPPGK